MAFALPALSAQDHQWEGKMRGMLDPEMRSGMTSGPVPVSMNLDGIPGGVQIKRGGQTGAIGNASNSPYVTTIQQIMDAWNPMARLQRNELIFRKSNADQLTTTVATPAVGSKTFLNAAEGVVTVLSLHADGSVASYRTGGEIKMVKSTDGGTLSSSEAEFLGLTALNHKLRSHRNLPGMQNPAYIASRWAPVGVVLTVDGEGWATHLQSDQVACTVAHGGVCHIMDYLTALYPEMIARPESVLCFELRKFGAGLLPGAPSAKSLRANGFDVREIPVKTAQAVAAAAAAAKNVAESESAVPEVPEHLEGIKRPPTNTSRENERDKYDAKAANDDTKRAVSTYWQWVPVVQPTSALQTHEDVNDILWDHAPRTYRFALGRIHDLSFQKDVRRPEVVLPNEMANAPPNFRDMGMLEVRLNIVTTE